MGVSTIKLILKKNTTPEFGDLAFICGIEGVDKPGNELFILFCSSIVSIFLFPKILHIY